MAKLQLTLHNDADTQACGRLLGSACPLPLVIGLQGDLGAGKTTLSQGIGAGFGVTGHMPSPTFTLINEYETSRGVLYHLDLYRLNSLDELFDLGLEDMLSQPNSLMIVEWIDRFDWLVGTPRVDLKLGHLLSGRSLEIEDPERCWPELGALLQTWQI